jgi:ubiquinone biosynthesis protein
MATTGNAGAMLRSGGLRTFARFLAIGTIGSSAFFIYLLGRLGTLFVFGRARRARVVARWKGRVLWRTMTILGPTFIKMGQVMSSRPDVFAPETIDELRKLQDRLPAFAFAKVDQIVREDLGAPIEELFSEFDATPVAAASVAQVHRARLTDGTEVAVKVLRPDIRAHIDRDCSVLLMLGRFFMLMPPARQNDALGHIRELVQGIVEQTDLAREADNLDVFRGNFAEIEGVIFPQPYRERSGPRVLTMSYIHGSKIDTGLNGRGAEVAELVRVSFQKMCYEDGFVHADLHPGNLLVTDSGDLAILDAGLVKRFGQSFYREFFSFTRCLVLGTPRDFVEHFRLFHPYLSSANLDAMENDLEQLMERFQRQTAAEVETSEFSNEVFGLFRKHKIRALPEITLVLVGTLTSEGIAKTLDPGRNSFQDIANYMIGMTLRRLAREQGTTVTTLLFSQ